MALSVNVYEIFMIQTIIHAFVWFFFWFVWVYGVSTFVSYLMPNLFLYIVTVLFQTIQFSISIVFLFTQLNVKIVLFQTSQFSISTQFSSI